MTLEHKTSLKSLGYICSNSQTYIVWVKIIDFSFIPKIIRILRSCSMKIFCTFYIANTSKLNFLLVICIAQNFIWTTVKMIFSIFRFIDSRYCPIITNHTSKENVLCYKSQFGKCTVMTGFVVQVTYYNEKVKAN